ncbi:MAG: sulfotransferase [Burkholderiaceae bacterium]
MKKSQPTPTAAASNTPPADAFSLAQARLGAERPLRNARLQQIHQTLQNNRLLQAERELNDHLARAPRDADALSLMARAQLRQGRRTEALAFLDRCLDELPGFAAARFQRAQLRFQLGRHDPALADLAALLDKDPANPLFLETRANLLETVGRDDEALAIWQRLAEAHPRRTESWLRYGHALRAMGRQADCIAAYRRAIDTRPGCGAAYWSLADLRTVRFDDADLAAMQAQLKRADLPPDDRTALQYALGKAFDDQGDHARSFAHYEQGAAGLRQRIQYDPDTLSRGVDEHMALLTEAFFRERDGAGCQSAEPIFVVSRPRSGSTLVEQMLASHPAIEGIAELPYIRAIALRLGQSDDRAYGTTYLKGLARLEPAALRALGEEYLASVAPHRRQGRPHFIDKMPANFYHLGLIRLILPRARIVDVRRHPAACCLSIFQSYTRKGVLRLPELGRFYRDYVRLMAHMDRVQPGAVHRVVYEQLVRDPEGELRALLAHLGLPFDEACLRFHETQRKLLTPSSEQVRRPIFGDAVDKWRRYEPWLGPLLDSLGPVATQYPAVPDELR